MILLSVSLDLYPESGALLQLQQSPQYWVCHPWSYDKFCFRLVQLEVSTVGTWWSSVFKQLRIIQDTADPGGASSYFSSRYINYYKQLCKRYNYSRVVWQRRFSEWHERLSWRQRTGASTKQKSPQWPVRKKPKQILILMLKTVLDGLNLW